MLDVLYVSPEAFRRNPQVGDARQMAWDEVADYLSTAQRGAAKDIAGAYSPASYVDNVRRKAAIRHVCALTVDLDDHGDVDDVADMLAGYRAIVHETFNSTNDQPRCRVVLALADWIDVPTYEATHRIVRAHLRAQGYPADEGAKDPSRLSYAPVRREGAGYRFRLIDGEPLSAAAVLAAQPRAPRRISRPAPRPEHRDRYIEGALRRAASEVSSASEGERHYRLCKEAFALARLGLTNFEIEAVLLPAFVQAAGEGRRREGERTISDAIRARKGAS